MRGKPSMNAADLIYARPRGHASCLSTAGGTSSRIDRLLTATDTGSLPTYSPSAISAGGVSPSGDCSISMLRTRC